MNLFRRRSGPAKPADKPLVPALPKPPTKPQRREIRLSAEHKSLLEKPVHPRVDRILQEIYADRAAAERALNARRIIEFPPGDSRERHVIQDERGFWRIVPDPAPMPLNRFLDAL
jgi:hypothetical protein